MDIPGIGVTATEKDVGRYEKSPFSQSILSD
jgi:hypothetical protein